MMTLTINADDDDDEGNDNDNDAVIVSWRLWFKVFKRLVL